MSIIAVVFVLVLLFVVVAVLKRLFQWQHTDGSRFNVVPFLGLLGAIVLLSMISTASQPTPVHSYVSEVFDLDDDDDRDDDDRDDDDDDDNHHHSSQKAKRTAHSLKQKAVKEPERYVLQQSASKADSAVEHVRIAVSKRPDWVDNSVLIEKKNLADYQPESAIIPQEFVVASGRWATVAEAEAEAITLANQLLLWKIHHYYGSDFVQERAQPLLSDATRFVTKTYQEPHSLELIDGLQTEMQRVYLQLDIEDYELKDLAPLLRQKTIENRLLLSGGVLGILALCCGSAAILLNRSHS